MHFCMHIANNKKSLKHNSVNFKIIIIFKKWLTLVEIFSSIRSVCISSFNVRLHSISVVSFNDVFKELWCVVNGGSSNEICIKFCNFRTEKLDFFLLSLIKNMKLKKFTKSLTKGIQKSIPCNYLLLIFGNPTMKWWNKRVKLHKISKRIYAWIFFCYERNPYANLSMKCEKIWTTFSVISEFNLVSSVVSILQN